MQEGRDPQNEETYPKVMVLLNNPTAIHSLVVFINGKEINIGPDAKRTITYPENSESI